MAKNSAKRIVMNTIKWGLAVFMFAACLVYGFSLASIIFALLGICFLPITPIQNFFNKILPRQKILRGIIAFVIFVVGCCVAPQIETTIPEETIPVEETVSAEATTAPIEDIPTEVTIEPTTPPVTEGITSPTTEPTAAPPTDPTVAPTEPTVAPENSSFEIHFIDVGQADAALILCDGKAMLIDGGNAEDSSLLYTYLKKHDISHLDYVIGTHAHEDHIGGLAGALNFASVDTAYCSTTAYESKAFNNFVKALDKHGVSITVPSVGDSFSLGSSTCTILAVNTDSNDTNNTSIVLRIVYGDTSFLFTGDAEREVEQAILNRGADINSTVLKVGHHGADTSTSYVWLREIMPQYAVISVGKGNSYGHPTDNMLSRLRDAEVTTFRTDLQGDIICVSDGSSVTFTVERNADADVFGGIDGSTAQQALPAATDPPETTTSATEETLDNGQDYVVNTNTHKFHDPFCSSADDIKASNRWDYHGTREELISMGYEPCKRCDP